MLYFDGLLGIVTLGMWIFCLLDVLTTREAACRNLPKLLWALFILLVPFVGSVMWLVTGRPREIPPAEVDPDDDAEFRRQVRERAEAQRRVAREKGGDV